MKAELVLSDLDTWMVAHRRFQTSQDHTLEKKSFFAKRRTYFLMAALGVATYTMTSEAPQVRHNYSWWWAKPVKDFYLAAPRMPMTPVAQRTAVFAAAFIPGAILTHNAESRRLNGYLKADTVFGEKARQITREVRVVL